MDTRQGPGGVSPGLTPSAQALRLRKADLRRRRPGFEGPPSLVYPQVRCLDLRCLNFLILSVTLENLSSAIRGSQPPRGPRNLSTHQTLGPLALCSDMSPLFHFSLSAAERSRNGRRSESHFSGWQTGSERLSRWCKVTQPEGDPAGAESQVSLTSSLRDSPHVISGTDQAGAKTAFPQGGPRSTWLS